MPFIVAAFLLGLVAGHQLPALESRLVHGRKQPMITTGVLAVKDFRGANDPGLISHCQNQSEGGLLPGTPVEVQSMGKFIHLVTVPGFFAFGRSLPVSPVSPEEFSTLSWNFSSCDPKK
jgi:hypothetical protein